MLVLIRYSLEKPFSDLPYAPVDVFEADYFYYRFNIFKEITLKSLCNQTYKGFKTLIYHSDKMPNEFKKLFIDIEKEYPFVRNIFQSGTKITIPKEFEKDIMLTVRLDNDNGLPKDIMQKLSSYEKSFFIRISIIFPNTIAIQRNNDNNFYIEERFYPQSPMAMAYVSDTSDKNVFDLGNHAKVYEKYPTLMLPGTGGLMTINGENCANNLKKHDIINKANLYEKIRGLNYPKFDFECLRKIPKAIDYNRGKLGIL